MTNPTLCLKNPIKLTQLFCHKQKFVSKYTKYRIGAYFKLILWLIACRLLPNSRQFPFNFKVCNFFRVRNDRDDIPEILLSLNSKYVRFWSI